MSAFRYSREGGGHTATCICGWVQWSRTRQAAESKAAAHAPKCKGAPVTQEPAPAARRGASNWNEREDSTWIDRL